MKWKIFVPVGCILIVLVINTIVFSSIRFTRYTELLFHERISVAANGLKKYLADCERDSQIAAHTASEDPKVIAAIEKKDKDEIIDVLLSSIDAYHVEFFTVTDADGNVLARTHEQGKYGDSVLNQRNIQEALNGNTYTCIEEGTVVKVSVRTGAPIYYSDGTLIGAISAGMRFDTNDTLDRLKDHYHADFGVYFKKELISSTVIVDDERIIGTPLNADVVGRIYSTKNELFGLDTVQGENYNMFYLPLLDTHGEIFAVIATGCSNAQLLAERSAMERNIILIGLLGLASSILVLLFITSRITKPITRLSRLVKKVTDGNLESININETSVFRDEIGMLTLEIYKLVDVIKSILSDLSYLTSNLDKFSDLDIQVDENKYSGSYKEIIHNIKRLTDSIATMRKTMAIMDYLDTMISVVDFDYNLLYVNRSMVDCYKMGGDSHLGEKCYKAIRNLEEPCTICQMEKLLPDKESYPSVDYEGLLDETSGKYIGGRAAIIRWVDNAQVFFNSVKDETVRIENQEQLRKATTAAQAASVAKTTFLANMSHEIRTPMNSIIGFSELALENAVNPVAKEYLAMIKDNAGLLMQIINNILDITKVESGNVELEMIPFDLQELLSSCKSVMMPRAIEKNIDLQFYAESSLGKVLLGDPTKLRQVLLNLLANAVTFTAAGSVKLLTSVISETKSSVTLRFIIRDTGIGMTSEQIAKVFDPFMQADASTTRKYGGTGLGMAITKNILDLMGSNLDIESEPGAGTVISFELTLETTEKIPEMSETRNPIKELDKPTFEGEVLVCEDNHMNQRVIIDHLGRVGLKAEIAENGQIGVNKVRTRIDENMVPFDLILMDIHMPVMDGMEATRKIIQMGTRTPIVAMTANIMADDRESYKAAGMADYVGKPFTSQELWRCLLKYLKPVSFARTNKKEGRNIRTEFHKKLEDDFVASNRNRFSEIMNALDANNLTLAHRLVHNLKSNAGLIGKTTLQKTAAEVEKMIKGGKGEVTEAQMSVLRTELYTVLDELSLNMTEATGNLQPAADLDVSVVRKMLDELEPLLKSGNPECRKMIDDLRAIPGSDTLVRQIEDYDFDAAAAVLSEMKKHL